MKNLKLDYKVVYAGSNTTVLRGAPGSLRIAGVERNEFEGWIAADLARIATCVDRLLERCDVPPSAVDRVFLTGGSSLVPSVRGIFADRFGADRLRGGEELTTVARGLAMMAGRD